jgi:hypothetical protein
MAKQIRWRVPFASVSGTLYEVEIYDEGWTGSPVVLTAGATPFVTDEDASDDFFAPVRSQTGTLQVCTQLADGTMLRLEDILPDNNIADQNRRFRHKGFRRNNGQSALIFQIHCLFTSLRQGI